MYSPFFYVVGSCEVVVLLLSQRLTDINRGSIRVMLVLKLVANTMTMKIIAIKISAIIIHKLFLIFPP